MNARAAAATGAPRAPRKPTARKGAAPAADRRDAWFAARGWSVFPFQREVWTAAARGESGLLHASTGSGKTYALWLAALQRAAAAPAKPGLKILWITPMRALAADTLRALQDAAAALMPALTIEARTGDTGSAQRARQNKHLPDTLITTPESLTLLLSKPEAAAQFARLDMIIIDEWHELMGNKRGVQTQLALARLRRWNPALLVWGLSATLGNLERAREALMPQGVIVEGHVAKDIVIDTLIPHNPSRFPWGGHLGLQMLAPVIAEIEQHNATLVFTNTRSQAELWYQHLLDARPDWAGLIALHHGSLDKEVRDWVEQGIKQGQLKAVVCTSSLDLGVDFLPVERVLQIGSAKGVARLMQRAGRSGHAPGRTSRVTLVPTHSLELIEAVAARDAVEQRRIEPRLSPHKPLDVLVQHLVSMALGGGFLPDELYEEVRGAWAYRDLTPADWTWALAFVRHGGMSLTAYPDYRRVEPDEQGIWRVPDARLARRHRMSIGTIVSDASIQLKFWSKGGGGKQLGSVEEGFIARLKPGDGLLFAGRLLELVRVENMTAYVKRSTAKKAAVPRWNGGRMPLSNELAQAVVARFSAAAQGEFIGPEMRALRPLLEVQQRWSGLPTSETLLAEALKSREGWHLFLYPFAGRQVHLGLASLLAWRVSQQQAVTFSIAVNDYGLELLSATEVDWLQVLTPDLLSAEHLLRDILASLNAGELALRRFREIARIAGLVFAGYPGAPKSTRQVQASSGLFFEVFKQYDAENLLLAQAGEEVLREELDIQRMEQMLARISQLRLDLHRVKRPTPLGFPLLVERMRESMSSEKLADRIRRMVGDLEKTAETGKA